MQLLVIQFTIKILHLGFILILNFITNIYIWNNRVTWQDIDYKLPEFDTIVSKHVGLW